MQARARSGLRQSGIVASIVLFGSKSLLQYPRSETFDHFDRHEPRVGKRLHDVVAIACDPQDRSGQKRERDDRRGPRRDGAPAALEDEVQKEEPRIQLDRRGRAQENAGPNGTVRPIGPPGTDDEHEQHEIELSVEKLPM